MQVQLSPSKSNTATTSGPQKVGDEKPANGRPAFSEGMTPRARTPADTEYELSEDSLLETPAHEVLIRTSISRKDMAEQEDPADKKKRLFFIIGGTVLLCGMVVAAWLFFSSSSGPSDAPKEPSVAKAAPAPAKPKPAIVPHQAPPKPPVAPAVVISLADQARKLGAEAVAQALKTIDARDVPAQARCTAAACGAALRLKDGVLYQSLAAQMPFLLTNDLGVGHESAWLDFASAQATAGDVVGAQCTLSRGLEIAEQEYRAPTASQKPQPGAREEYTRRQVECAIAILEKQVDLSGADGSARTVELVRKAAEGGGHEMTASLAYCLMLVDKPNDVTRLASGEKASAADPRVDAWVRKLASRGQIAHAVELGRLFGGEDDSWKPAAIAGCLQHGDSDKALELALSTKDQAGVVDVIEDMVSHGHADRAMKVEWRNLATSESLRAQAVLLPYLPKAEQAVAQIDKLPSDEPRAMLVLAAMAKHCKDAKDTAGYLKVIDRAGKALAAVRPSWTTENRLSARQAQWQKAYIQFVETVLLGGDQQQGVMLLEKLAPAVCPSVAGDAARLYTRLGRPDRAMNLPASERIVICRGIAQGYSDRQSFDDAWKTVQQSGLTDLYARLIEAEVASGGVKQAYNRIAALPEAGLRRSLYLTFACAAGDFLNKDAPGIQTAKR